MKKPDPSITGSNANREVLKKSSIILDLAKGCKPSPEVREKWNIFILLSTLNKICP